MAAWGAVGVSARRGRVLRHGRHRWEPAAIGRWPLALVCAACRLRVRRRSRTSATGSTSPITAWRSSASTSGGRRLRSRPRRRLPGVRARVRTGAARPDLAVHRPAAPSPGAPAGHALRTLAALTVALRRRAADRPPRPRRPAPPTGYLLAAQNGDGGFGAAPGQASDTLFSGWAALGLAAAGVNPADVRRGGDEPARLRSGAERRLPDTGSLERTMLAAGAAGGRPAGFGGRDLVAMLERDDPRPTARSPDQVNLTAFAVLALRAAAPRSRAGCTAGSPPSRTAMAGSASPPPAARATSTTRVRRSRRSGPGRAPRRAVHFLAAQQNARRRLPVPAGRRLERAVDGFRRAGTDRRRRRARHRSAAAGARRLGYLRSLIAPDGHVRYARGSDQTPVWVTAEALMALDRQAAAARAPLRLPPRQRPPGPARPPPRRPAAAAARRHRSPRPRPVTSVDAAPVGGVRDPLGALLEPTAQSVADRALAVCAIDRRDGLSAFRAP